MCEHTPGPWEIDYDNSDSSGGGQWYTVGPAKVWFPYNCSTQIQGQAKADAVLISATIDMLEALSRVEAATYIALLKGDYTSLPAMLADVQGTLAKAKGLK